MPTPEAQRLRSRAARSITIFVLVALAALVFVPGAVQFRVQTLRDEIDAAEPARALVLQLQYNLVREMASLSEVFLAGEPEYAERYREAREAEDRIFRQLRPLVASLGPTVQRQFAEAERRTHNWHTQIAEPALLAGLAGSDTISRRRAPNLFEDALRATAQLDVAILRLAAETRDDIQSAERLGFALVVVLGVLGLLASLAVARLYSGARRVAQIAEQRRQEAEAALREGARATESRTRLIRGVTHDVKNPLGAAKGFAELLTMGVRGPVAPGQEEYLTRIKRSLDHALAIIDDLLEVARSDSGALVVHPATTAIGPLIHDAADSYRAEAVAAGHEMKCDIDVGTLQVETDALRVHQVLSNLLSNAIKYTPAPGTIVVRAAVVDSRLAPGDGPWVVIEVSDTGPGIPSDLHEAIFDEFTRVDPGSRIKGHGLGLTIARRIARLLGGELTVTNGPHGGATFTFWLPASQSTDEGEPLVRAARDEAE